MLQELQLLTEKGQGIFEGCKDKNYYTGPPIESGATSIKTKPNAVSWLFNKGLIKPEMKIVDWGAGEFAISADFLREKGVKVYAYDPFNANTSSPEEAWLPGKVTSAAPLGINFDAGYSNFVLNVVPQYIEHEIITKVDQVSKKSYHSIRPQGDLIFQFGKSLENPKSFTYKWFVNEYGTEDQVKRLQNQGVDETSGIKRAEIIDFAQYGVQTAKTKFQRLSCLEEQGFKKIAKRSSWWLFAR